MITPRAMAAAARWAVQLGLPPRQPNETDLEFVQRVRSAWEALPIVRVVK